MEPQQNIGNLETTLSGLIFADLADLGLFPRNIVRAKYRKIFHPRNLIRAKYLKNCHPRKLILGKNL